MKRIVSGVVLLVLALAVSSFALEGKINVSLSKPAQLAGQELPKGEYRVVFTGTDTDMQVTFTSADRKVVVKTTAKVVDGPKASHTAVVTDNGSVKEILVAGKTKSLKFQ